MSQGVSQGQTISKVTAAFSFLEVERGDTTEWNSVSREEIGRALYTLGKLHYDKSDLVKAENEFLKAFKCAELPRDAFSVLKILGFLIRIASERL